MAFPPAATGSSFQNAAPFQQAQFDIFDWYPKYQSCVRYFLDHAQYHGPVQALAAFMNIQLPFQRPHHPIRSSKPGGAPSPSLPGVPSRRSTSQAAGALPLGSQPSPSADITLIPYIRRLVATGFDYPAVLHGFFGDYWVGGVGPIHEMERRNYLFAAKSDNWLKVKTNYDMSEGQTVPFLRPLQNVSEKEIQNAELGWSEWLAMQDWMLGPRAPSEVATSRVNIKAEEE